MMLYKDASPEVQSYIRTLILLLLTGLVLSAFAFGFRFAVLGFKELGREDILRQIYANGTGKVVIRPDIATFTVGVLTQDQKVKDAQLENTRRSNAVLGFLKDQGVEERDLKTSNYSIYPQYQHIPPVRCITFPCPPQPPPKIDSYQVRSTIEVKVRDLDAVDDILAGVIQNGANEVGSIQFTIDDIEQLQEEAREKAIQDAKRQARILVGDLNVHLGKIIAFSENDGGYPPIYARAQAFGGGFDVAEAIPSPSIEPGEQEIVSNVTITFEFK